MTEVVAIIPVRGRDLVTTGGMPSLGGVPLIAHTIEAARQAQAVRRVIVSTDSEDVARMSRQLGAEAPFLRPAELATPGTPVERVLQHALQWLEEREGYRPDVVVKLEMSHPFREEGLVDRVVQTLTDQQLDTVFTVYEERNTFWKVDQEGQLEPVSDEGQTRAVRRPLYKEIGGLVYAARTEVLRAGQRMGQRVGVVALRGLRALVDTQDPDGLELARRLLDAQEAPTPSGDDSR